MGTRANLIAKTSDGQWKRIYTRWDGYPDHHGPILLDHYQDQEKIDALMALGDLSSLGAHIGDKRDFEWMSKAYEQHKKRLAKLKTEKWRLASTAKYKKEIEEGQDICLAYGRDRGDTGIDASVYETVDAAIADTSDCGAEFVYVWDGQLWSLTTPEAGIAGMVSLRVFMKGEITIEQTVKAFGGDFVLGKNTIKASNPA